MPCSPGQASVVSLCLEILARRPWSLLLCGTLKSTWMVYEADLVLTPTVSEQKTEELTEEVGTYLCDPCLTALSFTDTRLGRGPSLALVCLSYKGPLENYYST